MPAASRRPRPFEPGPGHLPMIGLAALAVVVLGRAACAPRGAARHAAPGLTVVLDPGHGGADPGAAHGGLVEAELTYRMATLVRRELEKAGARTILTVRSGALGSGEGPLRSPRDAVFVSDGLPVTAGRESVQSLYRRAQIAQRAWQARRAGERVVFLSLHFDAHATSTAHGGFVCYDLRGGAPPALARRLSAALERGGLAGNRRPALSPRDLGVLNPAYNPVPERALVELATLTSPADRAAVRRPPWRARVARLLAQAVLDLR